MMKPEAGIEPASGFSGGIRKEGNCSVRPRVSWRNGCVEHERRLQFAPSAYGGSRKSVPPLAASGGRYALLDPSASP
uniref:Uncharacterized protein n=1 Tax=Agrobacterium tumefaciens TaxID=358 RepID=A0A2Z2PT78_AGRTU|nr:hypothetical protein [Agrobacterium radiobacter]